MYKYTQGEVERGRGEMLQRCPGDMLQMLLGQSRPKN